MGIFSLIIILTNFSFLIPQQTNMEKEAIAVFGFTNHLNSAGQPSKFDGDYYSYTLFLYDDKSFVYKFQNGRLKPRYEEKLGVWEISGKKLITNANKRQYTNFSDKEIAEKYSERTIYLLNNNRLCEEFGNICLQHRKGLPAWKLFKEYEN